MSEDRLSQEYGLDRIWGVGGHHLCLAVLLQLQGQLDIVRLIRLLTQRPRPPLAPAELITLAERSLPPRPPRLLGPLPCCGFLLGAASAERQVVAVFSPQKCNLQGRSEGFKIQVSIILGSSRCRRATLLKKRSL